MKKVIFSIVFLFILASAQAQLGGLLNKVKNKIKSKTEEKKAEEVKDSSSVNQNENKPVEKSIKVYSKYDFVPGEKIIVYEDFAQDAVGDFPDKWNTNSSGEVVTLDKLPGHWFMLTKKGIFIPEFIDSFPENFTMEFDLTCDNLVGSWGLHTSFVELANKNKIEEWQGANNRLSFHFLPGGDGNGYSEMDRRKNGEGEAANRNETKQFADISKPVHIAFWRQKERMRVYLNEEKAWDIPKAILPEAKFNSLIFWVQLTDDKSHFIMSNLRAATGAPDTRNKILTQNKWVTHGILFDVNSSNIKPQSYGSLKEMANVLKEYPDLKVKIVGHTDNVGKPADNLKLSEARAKSVVDYLAGKGIAIDRLTFKGMGDTKPIADNKTEEGKALNRRTEFVVVGK